ncbi:MAG: bL35 family ribosomal protein [Phycisphaerales bacterium]
MPKQKSHKGLLKRIKITKSGKIKFRPPNSRHLKSNKTGEQVQSYRKNRYARRGMIRRLSLLLQRPLRSRGAAHGRARPKEKAAATEKSA